MPDNDQPIPRQRVTRLVGFELTPLLSLVERANLPFLKSSSGVMGATLDGAKVDPVGGVVGGVKGALGRAGAGA